MRWVFSKLIMGVLVLGMLAGCGAGGKGSVIVGSKDFAEQYILGQMYVLLLEDAGYDIERKLGLEGKPEDNAAGLHEEINLSVEYTGTGVLNALKLPVNSDRQVVYDTVSEGYREQFDLTWLDPAPMNNAQALAVPRSVSEQYGIDTISDMVANASELVMVGPPEFPEREDGLPGLKENYGDFELKEYRAVGKALRYQAIANGEADVTVAFGTDGEISALDLVVLEDDAAMFPPYQVAPVIRQTLLDEHPDIADILDELAPLLTSDTMRRLNYEVTGNQQEPVDVARSFLIDAGLLSE